MSTIPASSEQRVVLRSVSWQTYVALTEESASGSGRMTYDRGVLEIMSPGMPHEITKRLLKYEQNTLRHSLFDILQFRERIAFYGAQENGIPYRDILIDPVLHQPERSQACS